jgi:hypothetical protein
MGRLDHAEKFATPSKRSGEVSCMARPPQRLNGPGGQRPGVEPSSRAATGQLRDHRRCCKAAGLRGVRGTRQRAVRLAYPVLPYLPAMRRAVHESCSVPCGGPAAASGSRCRTRTAAGRLRMKTSRNPSSTLARAIGEWPMISAASTPGRPEWDRSTPRQRDAQERVGEQVPDHPPCGDQVRVRELQCAQDHKVWNRSGDRRKDPRDQDPEQQQVAEAVWEVRLGQ